MIVPKNFQGNHIVFDDTKLRHLTTWLITKTHAKLTKITLSVPVFIGEGAFWMNHVQKMIHGNNSHIAVLDAKNDMKTNFVLKTAIGSLEEK